MKRNLLFLGNDGRLLREIIKSKSINLIGVVANKVSKIEDIYFGSSFSIGEKSGVPRIPQDDFKKNYKSYMKTIFKDTDIIFIHGYHYRINRDLYENKRIKAINFHQSLLPKFAGCHPLNWVIIKGKKMTGITFHYLNKNFDEGNIIFQKKIRISDKDDVTSLYNKTIKSASLVIGKVFKLIYDKSFIPHKQDLTKSSYFPPRFPEDGEILKDDTREQIRNKIKALAKPYPGAFINLNGQKIIIDNVRKIKNTKKYSRLKFANKYGNNIILRATDGLLKITKIRGKI